MKWSSRSVLWALLGLGLIAPVAFMISLAADLTLELKAKAAQSAL